MDQQLLKALKKGEREQYVKLFRQFSFISVMSIVFAAIAYIGLRDIYPYGGTLYGGVEFYRLVSHVLVVMVTVPVTLLVLYGFKVATSAIANRIDTDA